MIATPLGEQSATEWQLANRRLIIALHGVGASGASMRPAVDALRKQLPDTEFLTPDAPFRFDCGDAGRQWFSIRNVTAANRSQRVDAALPDLLAWVQNEMARRGLTPAALGFLGFSQGAILALTAATRGFPCAGVAAFAGRLLDPVETAQARSPEILLVHGRADAVIRSLRAIWPC